MRLLANWHCPSDNKIRDKGCALLESMPYKDLKGSHRLFCVSVVSDTSCQGMRFESQGSSDKARGGRKFDLLCGWARYCIEQF